MDDVACPQHGPVSSSLAKFYGRGAFERRLEKFEELIKDVTLHHLETSTEQKRHLISENLQFDEFSESVRVLFGKDVKNSDIQTIFQKIRTNPDARIDWSEVFGYHDNGTDDDDVFGRRLDRGRVFAIPQRTRIGEAAGDRKRRDVVVVIKYIPSLDCYVTVSLKGSLAVWRAKNFRLQSCMDVGDKSWVTAGDFLPNVRRMAICQERSISLYDVRVSGKKQEVQRFVVYPLEASVQCAVAVTSVTPTHRDVILYGDDEGHVGMITIDANDLTTAKKTGGSSRPDAQTGVSTATVTLDPDRLTHQRHRRKFHNEWVFKVKYIPQLRSFGSCSTDGSSSFVLGSLDAITDDRAVKGLSLARGVNAFDYCISANLIATGGADKTIRVWHSSIFTAPVGKLVGHLFTIVDIVINQSDQHVISLSSARVIRVWDINAMSPLQIFMNNDEIHGEKKIYSIFYNEKYEHLITGSSVLDMWPLTRAVQDQLEIPHTHDRSITQMLINTALNQLVTACAESTIKTWDLATGRLLSTNTAGHGRDLDITALAVDLSGYRLASGAVDGSIGIWEAGSGQELKKRERPKGNSFDDGSKVIGLDYCVIDGVRCIVVASGNNYVRILDESKTSRDLPTLKEVDCSVLFSDIIRTSGGFELTLPPIPVKTPMLNSSAKVKLTDKDEIRVEMTCADLLNVDGVDVFVTGFNNGKAILWNLIRMKADYVCHAPDGEENGTRKNFTIVDRALNQSVLAVKFLRLRTSNAFSYRSSNKDLRKSMDMPLEQPHSVSSRESSDEIVDQSGHRRRDQSDISDVMLVTCHADAWIRFWDLKGNLLGDVHVGDQEVKVTVCASDLSCQKLFTADDKGYVTVWKMDEFLENMENTEHIEQILSWRAHMTPIVQMAYVNEAEVIITASTDCSVRVWSSETGSYLGYFGQTERFDLSAPRRPNRSAFSCSADRLPYDISEAPQSPERRVRDSDRARLREDAKQLVEYPLTFDDKRWIPFRRSAYLHSRGLGRMPSNLVPSSNRKFFKALKKSAPRKNLMESYVTGDVTQGSIYRSLPVYLMRTPERVKTPEFTLPKIQDDNNSSPFRGTRIGGGSREMETDNKEDSHEVQVFTRPKKKKMSVSK